MDNLTKARALFREISGRKTYGVFTHRGGNVYHEGKQIDPTEQAQIAKQFETIINIKIKRI